MDGRYLLLLINLNLLISTFDKLTTARRDFSYVTQNVEVGHNKTYEFDMD